MEHLPNGVTLLIPPDCFPLSTDSILLSGFVRLKPRQRVLDLGSGCGTLGILLCAGHPDCTVTGVEISAPAHQAALDNIERNGLQTRMKSICADLCAMPSEVSPGSFQVCVSNPPYFTGGLPSGKHPGARQADTCPMPALFAAASRALQTGGRFFLVHRPENLAQLCFCAVQASLEPKRLVLVRHRPKDAPALILLECRKGGHPGLATQDWLLHDDAGNPTALYQTLYHR